MFHNLEHYQDHSRLENPVSSHFSSKKIDLFLIFFENLQTLINPFKIDPTALGPLPFDRSHQNLSFGIVVTFFDALGTELLPKMC